MFLVGAVSENVEVKPRKNNAKTRASKFELGARTRKKSRGMSKVPGRRDLDNNENLDFRKSLLANFHKKVIDITSKCRGNDAL